MAYTYREYVMRFFCEEGLQNSLYFYNEHNNAHCDVAYNAKGVFVKDM